MARDPVAGGDGKADGVTVAGEDAVSVTAAQDGEPSDGPSPVTACLLLGRMLFDFGASTRRIQDSIAYLARRLGCPVDLLTSYDALLVTARAGATVQTRIDASRKPAGLNLQGLVRVTELLRGLPGSQARADDVEHALHAIRDAPPVHRVGSQVFVAACASAAFCVVNGGDPMSWACSFFAGAFIFAGRRVLTARGFNFHLNIFAVALAGSVLAGLLARVTHTATPAVAVVAPVLFLVPGVPMINGGIDMVFNHVTVGSARIGFTLTVIGALSLGVGFALPLLPAGIGPAFGVSGPWETVLVSLAAAIAAGALACLNNGGRPLIALCAFGGLTARLVRALLSLGGFDLITASLLGVICSTLTITFVADRLRWPATFAAVMAALPMVPGYFAITGMHALLSFAAAATADPLQLSVGLQALSRALFISAALVVGVIGPVTVLQHDVERI